MLAHRGTGILTVRLGFPTAPATGAGAGREPGAADAADPERLGRTPKDTETAPMNTRILIALAGATVLAACGSDSKEPTGPGDALTSYQATFTGDVQLSLTGNAAFASDNSDEDVGFALGLVDTEAEDSDDMIIFYRANPGVPGTGAVTIADYVNTPDQEIPGTQLVAMAFLGLDTATPTFCMSTGGSVNVSSSSSTRLRGTFTMQMECAEITGGEVMYETTVTGNFDAAGGAVQIPSL